MEDDDDDDDNNNIMRLHHVTVPLKSKSGDSNQRSGNYNK
jgi:hypothetical protein